MRRIIIAYALAISALCATPGCLSAIPIVGVSIASAGGIYGLVRWLTNQPWMVQICTWVGNEGALVCMANANATVDGDTIAACALGIQYLQTAEGTPAATVNAQLAAAIANLPASEQGAIQEAAAVLDEFLPPSTVSTVLTSGQINDIIGFLKGWQTGTQTSMNELPPTVQKMLLQARAKKLEVRAKHPPLLRAAVKGGWFVPPAK